MLAVFAIIQAEPNGGSSASALGILNTLGIAVFLIGVGLLLLLSAHYYKMRDTIERKKKFSKRGFWGHESGDLMQLQYMTRAELREMVLKERAQQKGGKSEIERKKDWQFGLTDVSRRDEVEASQEPVKRPEPPMVRESTHADVLAKVLLTKEEPGEPEETPGKLSARKKESSQNPYSDQVQRSLLSNELPEEFRKKSRKI